MTDAEKKEIGKRQKVIVQEFLSAVKAASLVNEKSATPEFNRMLQYIVGRLVRETELAQIWRSGCENILGEDEK